MPTKDYAPIANPYMRSWMGRHARDRARERYHLELTDGDMDTIANLIAAKAPCVVVLRPNGWDAWRRLVAVRWGEEWVICAFDAATRTIVTFLPKRELAPYQGCLGLALARLRRREMAAAACP